MERASDRTAAVAYGGPMQRPRVVPVLVLLVALLPLVACGTEDKASGTSGDVQQVSEADQACRDRWHDLSARVAAQADRGGMTKRVFASRWESLAAGVAYYESTASADQCDKELDDEKIAIRAQRALLVKALRFDMESRLTNARESRRTFAEAHPAAKETAAVRAAYRTLGTRYVDADKAIAPAVVQLAATDPTDTKAITRRLKDLVLLAQTSAAWQACRSALSTIYAYQHPPKKKAKKG